MLAAERNLHPLLYYHINVVAEPGFNPRTMVYSTEEIEGKVKSITHEGFRADLVDVMSNVITGIKSLEQMAQKAEEKLDKATKLAEEAKRKADSVSAESAAAAAAAAAKVRKEAENVRIASG